MIAGDSALAGVLGAAGVAAGSALRPLGNEIVDRGWCQGSENGLALLYRLSLALGESLPVIVKLLAHSQIRTTSRYAHLEWDSVKVSAARVAASIASDFLHGGGLVRTRSSER